VVRLPGREDVFEEREQIDPEVAPGTRPNAERWFRLMTCSRRSPKFCGEKEKTALRGM
jgi:hypothetical protein